MQRIRNNRVRASVIVGGFALLVVLLYSAYAAYPYLRGPIVDAQATEGATETTIAGHTVRVSTLSIDGLAVPLAEDGSFSILRTYPPGYTVVVVQAVDRFGRTRERTLTFVTKPYASEKIESGAESSSSSTTTDGTTNGSL